MKHLALFALLGFMLSAVTLSTPAMSDEPAKLKMPEANKASPDYSRSEAIDPNRTSSCGSTAARG